MILTDVRTASAPIKSSGEVVDVRRRKNNSSVAQTESNKSVLSVRTGRKREPRTAKQARRKGTYTERFGDSIVDFDSYAIFEQDRSSERYARLWELRVRVLCESWSFSSDPAFQAIKNLKVADIELLNGIRGLNPRPVKRIPTAFLYSINSRRQGGLHL